MTLFLIVQPWLNLAGLVVDFVGVVLLAIEWRIALKAERREVDLAAREAAREFPPTIKRTEFPGQEMMEWMERQRKSRDAMRRARSAFSERSGWFTLAFVFIIVGYLMQMVGSIPLSAAS